MSARFGIGGYIIGVDEVGRGCLAGGVTVCAFSFTNNVSHAIRDSKKTSKTMRESLSDHLKQNGVYSIVTLGVELIERHNILETTMIGMSIASQEVAQILYNQQQIDPNEIEVIIDGNRKPKYLEERSIPSIFPENTEFLDNIRLSHLIHIINSHKTIQNTPNPPSYQFKCIHTFVGGDDLYQEISAASIIAKVHRDLYMKELHQSYPEYKWDKNAGYGTKEHVAQILKHGPTAKHRISFLKKIIP